MYLILIFLIINIFLTVGCKNSYITPCIDLNNQYNHYKNNKINCIITEENFENDKINCLNSKHKNFKLNFSNYMETFINRAEQKEKNIKIFSPSNIQNHTNVGNNRFCPKLYREIEKAFQYNKSTIIAYELKNISEEKSQFNHSIIVKRKLNKISENILTEHKNILKKSLVLKKVSFKKCKKELQNFRSYKIRTNNREDLYFDLYKREYNNCLKINNEKSNNEKK